MRFRDLKLRTWIEIDKNALINNLNEFLSIVPPHIKFAAIIKSNAYGHGLSLIAELLANHENFKKRGYFGVDSITEALKLRLNGIKMPILVLGFTLPARLVEARDNDIIITVSSFFTLNEMRKRKIYPKFHLKIDSGMHRQGFLSQDLTRLIRELKRIKKMPEGIYTHFASAKDRFDRKFTSNQLNIFNKVCSEFNKIGLNQLIVHASATGGTLIENNNDFNMVRVGIGLYGYFPSFETEVTEASRLTLKPVLSWYSIVSEVKKVDEGEYVGYDYTERLKKKTKLAVIPIGYWHGFDRELSSIGEILIRGLPRRVIGRVSMDMIVVDVSKGNVEIGDVVTIIGRDKKSVITIIDMAKILKRSYYEVVTRINPLIKKIII